MPKLRQAWWAWTIVPIVALIVLLILDVSANIASNRPGTKGASDARSLIPDTTSGIHAALVFNDKVTDPHAEQGKVDFVWGAHQCCIPTSVYNTYYFPFQREPGTQHNISWFLDHHPDWIEYRCDRKTLATESDDPNVPLDIANPRVRDYMWSNYLRPALTRAYKGIAFDNVAVSNYSSERCGHFTSSHTWAQQYSGQPRDNQYATTVLVWAQDMYRRVHAQFPDRTVAMNFTYDPNASTESTMLYKYLDVDLDEQGFTNGGQPGVNYVVDSDWEVTMKSYSQLESDGGGLVLVNQEPTSFSSLTDSEKQWCIANYLLIKNNRTFIYISGRQEYGQLLYLPDYTIAIGAPMDAMHQYQGIYVRDYSDGLALVNPSSTHNAIVQLPGVYKDHSGRVVEGSIDVSPRSGLVLLRPP
jgi:hypothetical protein